MLLFKVNFLEGDPKEMKGANMRISNRGLTLIELLAVVLIVAILAGIAVPIYTHYMVRARRADAKTVLVKVRAAQEMWRALKGCYAQDNVDCQGNPYAGTAYTKLTTTMGVPASPINGPNGDYTWAFTVSTATTFTAQATPISTRQQADGWLQIDQDGTKTDQQGLIYPDPNCKWSK
jgi:type IV pilus assembly protein PilE